MIVINRRKFLKEIAGNPKQIAIEQSCKTKLIHLSSNPIVFHNIQFFDALSEK
jgi:hypothetical protein